MLALRGVSRIYGRVTALQPTDLAIAPGRTTVLIGPSGSGKSTVLKLMVGLVRPDTGTVLFDHETVTSANLLSIRRRIGYVVQDGGLFPHLTGGENAALLMRHLRRDPAVIAARIAELAGLTRLPADALDRYPVQLSGGQRQRVSLMRALMPDPDVLLLDEPLGALDPVIRSDLGNDLKEIFQTLRKTVVFVTHDMAEAAFFGDRLVLMKDGAILQQGTFAELVASPAHPFVLHFIRAQRRLPSLEGVLPA
jgi:osmoprotectant transport system ATP-binding protein